jgi:hypothetical protein
MNMTNAYQIKLATVPQVLDRSIISMNSKYYSKLSKKSVNIIVNYLKNHAYTDQHIKYVRYDLRAGVIHDLWFPYDDDRMKKVISLTKFALKATTLDT